MMMKLEFINNEEHPETNIELYNSISRVPFTITFKKYNPGGVNYSDYYNNSFIELRFDGDGGDLYDISIVNITNYSNSSDMIGLDVDSSSYYKCKIADNESQVINDTAAFEIFRMKESFLLIFGSVSQSDLNYFQIAKNIYFGVDKDSLLKAFLWKELSEDNLNSIFIN